MTGLFLLQAFPTGATGIDGNGLGSVTPGAGYVIDAVTNNDHLAGAELLLEMLSRSFNGNCR